MNAPIFLSLETARDWAYDQCIDDQLLLCQVELESGIRYEFHSCESIRYLNAYYPNLVTYSIVETWV